jgi:DNA-binding CsgD family transcriptional regulator
MPPVSHPRLRGLAPLLVLSVVLVLVTVGLAEGWWPSNLHNGLLALSCSAVGAYVLHQRPGHLEGRLLLVTGMVQAVMFLGRQVGHVGTAPNVDWWAWVGVWPVPVAVGLTTVWIIHFPDGRLPSSRWRPVVVVVVVVTLFSAMLSAGWPVGYDSAGIESAHPIQDSSPALVSALWRLLANPSFVVFQLLWVVVLVARWRARTATRQLLWLVAAVLVAAVVLVLGLVVAGSPRAGLLTLTLIPIAAGLAIVHGQHATAYSALSWLSRSGVDVRELPAGLARAAAEAMHATTASLWLGAPEGLHSVGLWPETGEELAPASLAALTATPGVVVRSVHRGDQLIGALAVERPDPLSRAEEQLLDDLARQAGLVLDHLTLTETIAGERRAGHLDGLTVREHDVLELISRGLSNSAICDELHLSIKTVEPLVGSIFAKLGLYADSASNRRVLAALQYARTAEAPA